MMFDGVSGNGMSSWYRDMQRKHTFVSHPNFELHQKNCTRGRVLVWKKMFCPGRKFDLCNWATEMYFDVFSKYQGITNVGDLIHFDVPSLDAWHAARWKQWKQADPGSPPIDLESLPGDGHMEGK